MLHQETLGHTVTEYITSRQFRAWSPVPGASKTENRHWGFVLPDIFDRGELSQHYKKKFNRTNPHGHWIWAFLSMTKGQCRHREFNI